MVTVKTRALALSATALAAVLGTPAFAADANDDSATGGDIIVTARRSEERLQDVPISITVFSQQELTNRNISSAGDLGTYTPSLATNANFGPESTSFAIRGFTQEIQTAPTVAVYFADAPAPRANGGTTAGNGAGVGSLFDLQNVQVLKGPQGTLFGINTTGGAILLVPQKPTDRLEGYVEGSAGSYNMWRLQGVINLPVSDNLKIRLGVDHMQRDGYLKNISGIGPNDFDDVHYTAVRGSVLANLGPDLENYLVVNYSDSSTHGYLPKVRICNPAPTGIAAVTAPLGCAQVGRDSGRYFDVENGDRFAHQRIRQLQAVNTTTWSVNDTLTIKNIASYDRFTQDQSYNIFGENFSLGPGVPFAFVSFDKHPGLHNTAQQTFTEELQLQGHTADNRLVWQMGGYMSLSNPIGWQGTYSGILMSCTNVMALQCVDPLAPLFHLPAVGHVADQLTQYRFRDYGLYAQATYKLTDQLSLTGGIRYTWNKTIALGEVRNAAFLTPNTPSFTCAVGGAPAPTPETCLQSATEKSSRPTWLIDLDYKPASNVLVYAKWARGYREGGSNASQPGFAAWQPEKVDNYEIGAKTSFSGVVRGTFNIAGFYNKFSNQQLQANSTDPSNPIAPIVNAGRSTIYGVEVDASIQPFEGLTIQADYTWLHTRLDSITLVPGLVSTAVVGGPLTLSPRNRITVTGTYTLPFDQKIGEVSIGATFTHTDSQVSTNASPLGILPSTDLLNLNLNWNSVARSGLDLSVFGTNVTNQKYWVYASGAYPSAGFDSVSLGQPRMWGVRAKVHF